MSVEWGVSTHLGHGARAERKKRKDCSRPHFLSGTTVALLIVHQRLHSGFRQIFPQKSHLKKKDSSRLLGLYSRLGVVFNFYFLYSKGLTMNRSRAPMSRARRKAFSKRWCLKMEHDIVVGYRATGTTSTSVLGR